MEFHFFLQMEQQSILRLLVIWAVSTFRLTQQYSANNDKGKFMRHWPRDKTIYFNQIAPYWIM